MLRICCMKIVNKSIGFHLTMQWQIKQPVWSHFQSGAVTTRLNLVIKALGDAGGRPVKDGARLQGAGVESQKPREQREVQLNPCSLFDTNRIKSRFIYSLHVPQIYFHFIYLRYEQTMNFNGGISALVFSVGVLAK